MDPATLTLLIRTSAQVAAELIAYLRSRGHDNEANQIEGPLRRADENYDLIIKRAQEALHRLGPISDEDVDT